jgi:hypothetical protein
MNRWMRFLRPMWNAQKSLRTNNVRKSVFKKNLAEQNACDKIRLS